MVDGVGVPVRDGGDCGLVEGEGAVGGAHDATGGGEGRLGGGGESGLGVCRDGEQ